MYLEAGGAHGDAHIRHQGAEVLPLEGHGPAFDQDVPPAHQAQHRTTHLDWDKGGTPLLLGQTMIHVTMNRHSLRLCQRVTYKSFRLLTSKLILAVNGSSKVSSKPSSLLKTCSSEWNELRSNSFSKRVSYLQFYTTSAIFQTI